VYKKVLVPLDGSKLSEVVLPHLEEVAKGCSIPEIVLVSVTDRRAVNVAVEEFTDTPHILLEETPEQYDPGKERIKEPLDRNLTVTAQKKVIIGKLGRSAEIYLKKIAAGLAKNGFNTSINVLVGDPVKEIVKFANNEGIDLIVMTSWGKHGLSKWSVANVAEKIFRQVSIPMMLVKPPVDFKETKPSRKGTSE